MATRRYEHVWSMYGLSFEDVCTIVDNTERMLHVSFCVVSQEHACWHASQGHVFQNLFAYIAFHALQRRVLSV